MSKTASTLNKRMNIVALTWPIFVEVLLRTALNTTDVFMLSGYSDLAVSAVGVITQITFFLIVVSMMVSSGTGILIAQFNGASRFIDSAQVGVASILLACAVGSFLSLSLFLGAEQFISLFGLEKEVAGFGYDYLIISGSMTFNVTIGIVLTTILRSHGYSRSPMVINLIAGVINIAGNYIALYQPFGLPVFGVSGVATATVVSQLIGTLLMCQVVRSKNIDLPFSQWRIIPKALYKKIVKIGAMNAGEILSYNLAQMTIVYFVVQMGTSSLAAYTYSQNITRVSFAFALALGQAGQIQTSYFIGKGWTDDILHRIQKYYLVGLAVSISIILAIFLFRYPLIDLFTQDSEIVALVAMLIAGSLFVESGRVSNLIFIAALKGSGDIKFPVQMGILSMWGVAVLFSYLFGIHWGYGVIGAWIAIGLDEWVRGIVMIRRWRSKVWTRFQLT
ncbi:MATE family efflux transporter [Vibrio sp. 10N.286.49.C2]|uniref:MATE family efflux transporter n=1 Tax=unclassified Vibrio TaxID=2614977 RepID=UPI000C82B5AB|nr:MULTISPECIES: MATE family efflux transporter [unclassified Vibrio]PMH29610.1 MATE family efflux transporter [Vibrio sp. 10N.286.49.C2]PMH56126.1 MATE family efflux transporter [Vibrio sp. 10N.286.49.B1]PMH81048.1 MATE family efflux transporter [Vibrio sp. 10N.286.48.B7]